MPEDIDTEDVSTATTDPPAETEETFTCACCDDEHSGESHETVDGTVCQSCRDNSYSTCERCDDVVRDNTTLQVGDQTWCESCIDGHSCQCADCGDRFDREDCSIRHDGAYVCDSCGENYFTCESCERRLHDDLYDGDGLCQSCAEERQNDGPIQDYNSSAPSRCWGDGPHYFGIELEVECEHGDRGEKAQECLDLFPDDFLIAKDDGSLKDGFELVTAPASLRVQTEKWSKFFENVPSGLKSFNTTTCGLHVHCSREPLTQLQIAKIVCFVNALANKKFIETIAARTSEHYAKIYPKKIGSAHKATRDRYEAVNLLNCETIEFRIFKGTLKKESFFKAVEFCDALIKFCETGHLSIQDSMSQYNFIEFVRAKKKQWPHLHAFIEAAWFGIPSEMVTEMGFRVQRRAVTDTTTGEV